MLVRHPRARRYLLRLLPEGVARVTIPRGGSAAEARRFARRHAEWLSMQLRRLDVRSRLNAPWQVGSTVLFRGERVSITEYGPGAPDMVRFADETVVVGEAKDDLRPTLERHMRALAARELPRLVCEFAGRYDFTVRKVTVRNQRTRWGSCSPSGTISLNWRLIQTPLFVRDYIIVHELCHLREMNHSVRFWRLVKQFCPDFETAERWLRQHAILLG